MEELQREINKSTITAGGFEFPLSVTEQVDKQSTRPWKTDHPHSTRAENAPRVLTRTDHLLGHTTTLTYLEVLKPQKVYPLTIMEFMTSMTEKYLENPQILGN